MIEINLIPSEFRKKKKSAFLPGGSNIPLEILVGSVGGLLFLLILIHSGLFVMNAKKISTYKHLEREWKDVLPAKKNVDVVLGELKGLQEKYKAIEEITKERQLCWAQKLNALSNALSKGVWLKKVVLDGETFFLEGSAISRQKKEMINVHRFVANLKKEDQFLQSFEDLELGSIRRRTIKKIEIADFLITTKLK